MAKSHRVVKDLAVKVWVRPCQLDTLRVDGQQYHHLLSNILRCVCFVARPKNSVTGVIRFFSLLLCVCFNWFRFFDVSLHYVWLVGFMHGICLSSCGVFIELSAEGSENMTNIFQMGWFNHQLAMVVMSQHPGGGSMTQGVWKLDHVMLSNIPFERKKHLKLYRGVIQTQHLSCNPSNYIFFKRPRFFPVTFSDGLSDPFRG